jgi:hypothetical protein
MPISTPSSNSPIYTATIDDDRRDIDVADDIAQLVPEATPFTIIMMQARKKASNTAKFVWYDTEPGGWWTQINHGGGYTDSETDLVVDDATLFREKDIIKVPDTDEVMLVQSVNEDTNTITVERGYGTTSADSLDDNDYMLRMGNAMEESSVSPDPKVTQPTEYYNYTQIFRRPFTQSATSAAESLRTSMDERTRLRQEQAIEHKMDIERAILFGERKKDVAASTNNVRRMTGGLLSYITTNVYDASSAFDEDKLEEFCEMLFQYGSDNKLLICSRRVGSNINKFARDNIRTVSGDDTYGLRLKQFESFHGDLYIVPTQTFENSYQGLAIGVDMDNVSYRPLRTRDTTLRTNIQDDEVDGWKDEYLTEVGIEVRQEKVHAVLQNADQVS